MTEYCEFIAFVTENKKAAAAFPRVIEHRADWRRSVEFARRQKGTLIGLERLLQLLGDPDFVKYVESTDSYKRNGYTWFWINTIGTNLNGYYRINRNGKSLGETFQFVSEKFDRNVEGFPFGEIVHFSKGDKPLAVSVWGLGVNLFRLNIGSGKLEYVAPVVVVEHGKDSGQAKPTAWANGVVVPTEQLNAAKKAFRNQEPL